MFNDDAHVVTLNNVVLPEIFKVEINVEEFLNLINGVGFNI